MNLSTNIKTLALAIVAAASLSSCNDIKEEDRFISIPAIEAKRTVLIEEYTGQLCVNCPSAHTTITRLLAQHPDNLISVSIHGGGDSFSYSEDRMPKIGLRTSESQAYCDESNVKSLPSAVINRRTAPLAQDEWANKIDEELAKPSDVDLNVEAKLSADGKMIQITTEVTPYENGLANLQLWVVESGIVSIQWRKNEQTKKDEIIRDYEHNHIFRASVNGHNGEPIRLVTETPQMLTHEIELRDDAKCVWNPDNLSIVAFVYDNDGIKQAAKCHVEK